MLHITLLTIGNIYEKSNVTSANSSIEYVSFGMNYSAKFTLLQKYQLEIRPGITFGGDYWGPEIGFYIRRQIVKPVFVIVGLNLHQNIRKSNDGGFSSSATTDYLYTNPSFALGWAVFKKMSIILSANKMHDGRIYSSFSIDPNAMASIRYEENMNWIFKLGFELGTNMFE